MSKKNEAKKSFSSAKWYNKRQLTSIQNQSILLNIYHIHKNKTIVYDNFKIVLKMQDNGNQVSIKKVGSIKSKKKPLI